MNISADFQNHWLWQDKPFSKGQAWIDMVLQSEKNQTHTILRNKVFRLNKGQIITSDNELASRWGWSRTKLRDFLSLLQDTSMIKIDRDHAKTIITILNQPEIQELNQTESEVTKQLFIQQVEQGKKQVENTPNVQQTLAIHTDEKQALIQAELQDKQQVSNAQKYNPEPKFTTKQSYPIQLDLIEAIEKEKKNEKQ